MKMSNPAYKMVLSGCLSTTRRHVNVYTDGSQSSGTTAGIMIAAAASPPQETKPCRGQERVNALLK